MRHKEIGHDPMPTEWVDSANPAAASSQRALVNAFGFSDGAFELKVVVFQPFLSTTLLYYTNVKFNQEKK